MRDHLSLLLADPEPLGQYLVTIRVGTHPPHTVTVEAESAPTSHLAALRTFPHPLRGMGVSYDVTDLGKTAGPDSARRRRWTDVDYGRVFVRHHHGVAPRPDVWDLYAVGGVFLAAFTSAKAADLAARKAMRRM